MKFGHLNIDPVAYGSQGGAVLGIRDSGKTYTATLLAEKLFEAEIPFVAFDPVGVWRFLRVPGEGRGYPVVVAGGEDGDLALTPTSAPAIVEAAMQNGVSLVIDLFSMELSKADWRRIVRDCVKLLLHRNKQYGLRHVFIEEAAEFIPQKNIIDGEVYAAVEKLARMGGNSRLGYTLINQRAEEVNKAVLELCDNLFLHRQKGKNSLLSLQKWLDVGSGKGGKEIVASLSTLPTGECWAWLAGTDDPVHVKVPTKNSLHPDRRVTRGDAGIKIAAAVDVGAFVDKLKVTLPKLKAEADANDPKKLKARIAELERQLRAPTPNGHSDEDMQSAMANQNAAGFEQGVQAARERIKREAADLRKLFGLEKKYILDTIASSLANLEQEFEAKIGTPTVSMTVSPPTAMAKPATKRALVALGESVLRTYENRADPFPSVITRPLREAAFGDEFSKAERAVVTALALWESMGHTSATREQVALLAGYHPNTKGFQNALSSLRTSGMIQGGNGAGESLTVASRGLCAVDRMSVPEMHKKLRENFDGAQTKLFDALLAEDLDRPSLAYATGYHPNTKGFQNALSRLNSLTITTKRDGKVALSDWVTGS